MDPNVGFKHIQEILSISENIVKGWEGNSQGPMPTDTQDKIIKGPSDVCFQQIKFNFTF